jgi:hypothetical protein
MADLIDNTPEWGYCTTEGCRQAALPIWFTDDNLGDPDLSLCHRHTGLLMKEMFDTLRMLVWGFERGPEDGPTLMAQLIMADAQNAKMDTATYMLNRAREVLRKIVNT